MILKHLSTLLKPLKVCQLVYHQCTYGKLKLKICKNYSTFLLFLIKFLRKTTNSIVWRCPKRVNLYSITLTRLLKPGWLLVNNWAFSPWMWYKFRRTVWNFFHFKRDIWNKLAYQGWVCNVGITMIRRSTIFFRTSKDDLLDRQRDK